MTASPTVEQPSPNGINRRSVSIFSRRGTETPTPHTQALVATTMSMAFTSPPPIPTGLAQPSRPKKWKLGKNTEVKAVEGTILRMVPKKPVINCRTITSLEREMATSPNEEILRNIGRSPPTSEPTSPAQATMTSPVIEFSRTVPIRRPTNRERKNSQAEIVGVWRNGKTEWDSSKLAAAESDPIPRPKSADGEPENQSLAQGKPRHRPSIRLVIPNRDSLRRPLQHVPILTKSAIEPSYSRDITVSHTISQEVSPSIVVSGETASPFEFFAVSPPNAHAPKPRRASHAPANIAAIMETSTTTPEVESQRSSEQLQVQHFRTPSATSSFDSLSIMSSDNEDSSRVSSSRSSMTSVTSKSDEHRLSPQLSAEGKQAVPSILKSSLEPSDPARTFACRSNIHNEASVGFPMQPAELEGSPVRTPVEGPRLANIIAIMRQDSVGRPRRRMSSRRGTTILSRKPSEDRVRAKGAKSPSLSEAERELEAQLSIVSNTIDTVKPEGSDSPLGPVPTQNQVHPPPVPPKSVKRRYPYASPASPQISLYARRRRSFRVNKPIPQIPKRSSRRLQQGRLSSISEEQERKITAKAAETVVFKVLDRVETLDDLFNTALANKGFYRVFKRNELQLMRSTLKKMNAAAWEYRETCLADSTDREEPESARPLPDYTPTTYYQTYTRDTYIIGALKVLILDECQSFLRHETVSSLKVHDPFHPSRVDCALWRIWTFCSVFGSNKGREDDITAQMDWLRGGVLAHQDTCTSTISMSDSFCMGGVLLNAPEHFGQGNHGGLSAEELYDMTEMWNCLNHITQTIIGRTVEARQYGVYDCTEVRGGDIDGEETMLEEWHSYLLSLGLGPILSLASHNFRDDASIFVLAKQNGWTQWTPPILEGSRSTFLREPVARLYEERICEAFATDDSKNQQIRHIRRSRCASYSTELKQRKMSGGSTQLERLMSSSQDVLERLSAQSSSSRDSGSASGHSPKPQSNPSPPSPPISETQHTRPCVIRRKPAPRPTSISSTLFSPISPTSYISQPRSRPVSSESLPPYQNSRPASTQHPLQIEMADPQTMNSADRAIFRIVEMGFSPEDARGALKITDMGDGLRVDRAVEFLLRQAEGLDFYQSTVITQ